MGWAVPAKRPAASCVEPAEVGPHSSAAHGAGSIAAFGQRPLARLLLLAKQGRAPAARVPAQQPPTRTLHAPNTSGSGFVRPVPLQSTCWSWVSEPEPRTLRLVTIIRGSGAAVYLSVGD